MYLPHALLLLGVIVFASKVKSIQAYALVHEGKNVPDDDFHQSGTAATGNDEERDILSMLKPLRNVIRRMFPASKTTRLRWKAQDATDKANRLTDIATKKAKVVERQLTNELESLMAQRKRDKKSPRTFFDSHEYNQMAASIQKANLDLPIKNAFHPTKFILSKIDPKDRILMIEAATNSADEGTREQGFQLLTAYMTENFKPPSAKSESKHTGGTQQGKKKT